MYIIRCPDDKLFELRREKEEAEAEAKKAEAEAEAKKAEAEAEKAEAEKAEAEAETEAEKAEEKELMEIYILKKKNNPTGIYELENEFCKIVIIDKNKWKNITLNKT
jgi:uncharacterized protein YaiL (DUF2058 family)